MREFARRPAGERRDLFRATAQKMQLHEAIIEKDFWVCWVLGYLFDDSPWKNGLVFKGGTSLSKAYGAIERFSEDVDLILDWRLLGYTPGEPWAERSATQQDNFGKQANQRATEFLNTNCVPVMAEALTERAGSTISIDTHGQDVQIHYPKAFALDVIQPTIRLEIGPMAAWVPHTPRVIRPYAAEHFPRYFERPETRVRTITAERTFWEKATILHQEAHRGPEKSLPSRYSRHYYDLYRLSTMPIRQQALSRIALLTDVVEFKMRFYRCPWARYEEAMQGALKLLPPEHHLKNLERDYKAMQPMLFGQRPSFENIMTQLAELEQQINRLGRSKAESAS